MSAGTGAGAPAAEPTRVLIVDDNPHDAELETRQLRRAGLAVDVRVAMREREFRAALAEFAPDVILCDFSFPDFDGLAALSIARELVPMTPVIFVSGTISEERAVIAVRNGACDYVLKTNLTRLPDAVTRAVDEAREKMRRRAAEEALLRLSRIRDVLSAVNSAIVRIDEPEALFREACRIAASIGGFPVAMVGTIDTASGEGRVQAFVADISRGVPERIMAEIARDPQRARGAIAESLRLNTPVVLNDLELEAHRVSEPDSLRKAGVRACGSFPFVIDRTLAGVLFLGAYEHGFFSDEEIELVTGLTNNVAFALELAAKRKRIDYLSYYDPLTELPNRTLSHERLRQEIAAAARRNDGLALLVFDLAQFASINTTIGEWAGDTVLRTVAQRLGERVDPALAGRIAGDRFSMLVCELRSAHEVTDKLSSEGLKLLAEPIVVGERELRVTAHVGCAMYPDDGDDADELFRNAEAALQSARAAGAPYRFYAPEHNLELARRIDLEARLRRATLENSFVLYYQPKVDLTNRHITGVEALIRWRDPDRPDKMISPGEFIPILEETGLIVEVGRWALGEAVRQHHAWLEAGFAAPRIAVNVSSVQLRGAGLIDDVIAARAQHPGESGLDLEVTESGLMGNMAEAIETLRRIRGLSVEIALDDFGTGYSSLSYVFQLPINTMKIDRSFIDGMTDQADKMTIVSTMISLGHELKLRVIAEGVELEEQARLLRLLRCDQMQGFLIARPLPPDEVAPLLERR